jgi:hypothetical protein
MISLNPIHKQSFGERCLNRDQRRTQNRGPGATTNPADAVQACVMSFPPLLTLCFKRSSPKVLPEPNETSA